MPNKITALLQAPLDSKCEARECGKTDRHVFSPDALFLPKPPPPPPANTETSATQVSDISSLK